MFLIKYPPQNTRIIPNIAFKLNCPCKKIKDHVYNLYNNTKSATIMADLDIDKNQDVYSYLKIKSIPTFICYTRGIKCDVLVGSGEDDVTAFFESCEKHN